MTGQTYNVNRTVGRGGESLSDGQVATTTGAILTVGNSVNVMIRSATFFNTNAATQTLNIYVTRSGGTRRQLYQTSVAQNASYDLLSSGEVLCLSGGDLLEADTTTVSAVDYLITGISEDVG